MRARMRWLGPALVCAVLAPASAEAATLVNEGGVLTYTGQPGEDNTVEIGEVYGSIQVGPMRGGTATGCRRLDDQIFGCIGVHTIVADLGDGDDLVFAGGRTAHLLGGPGDDELIVMAPAPASTISGGPGIDTAILSGGNGPVSVTLDGLANDGILGAGSNVADDVENLSAGSRETVTLVGNAGPNVLSTGDANDRLTGGNGSDVLFGRGGDDVLDARDGEVDRVECGTGADTAYVDQLDLVSDTCETVQVTARTAATVEDLPPTLSFTGSGLEVTAGDDRGVVSVRFLVGDRELCTDTTAPFACTFKPGIGDVGRKTIVAITTDTAGQTATAVRTITVPRFTPRSVSLAVKRQGRRFVATGKVALPAGVPCSGEVAVKAGANTRTGKLSRTCTYRIVLPTGGRFVATYRGTAAIEAKRSPVRTAR